MLTYPIKYITDKEGNRVLPKTSLKAVVDSNGTPLNTIIENLADNEDLKIVNNHLKFNDRPNIDGMGRVILRKNLVNGVNTLTQSMINQSNTIYVIQYDFDLGGSEVTIPANCVLEFDGGSLRNGTLVLNDTLIISNEGFKSTVNVSGTVTNSVVTSSWFEMPVSDSFNQLKYIVNIANASNKPISIEKGNYTFKNDGYQVVINQSIDFNGSTITLDTNGYEDFYIICRNSLLEDVPSSDFAQFKDAINNRVKHNDLYDKYRSSMIIVKGEDNEMRRYHSGHFLAPLKQKEFFYIDANGYRYNDFFNDRNAFGNIEFVNKIDCTNSGYFRNVKIKIVDTFGRAQTKEYRYIGLWIKESSNFSVENVIVPYTGIEDYNYILVRVQDSFNFSVKDCNFSNTKDSSESILGEPSSYVLAFNTIIGLKIKDVLTGNLEGDAWGAIGSNYLTDVSIKDSAFSRIDTHYRLNNLDVDGCTIGKYGITYTGFGVINVRNSTFKRSELMFRPRADYGSFFDGNITIENCVWIPSGSPIHLFRTYYYPVEWEYNSRLLYITARHITINNLRATGGGTINVNYFNADTITTFPESPTLLQPSIYVNNIDLLNDTTHLVLDGWRGNNKLFANPIEITVENVDFNPRLSRLGHFSCHSSVVDWNDYFVKNNYDNVITFINCTNIDTACIIPNTTLILNNCHISSAYGTGVNLDGYVYNYSLLHTIINTCRYIPRIDLDSGLKLPFNDSSEVSGQPLIDNIGSVFVNGLFIDAYNDDLLADTVTLIDYKTSRGGYIGNSFANKPGLVYYSNCFVSKRIADILDVNGSIPLPISKQTQDHYTYYDGTYQKEVCINENVQKDAMGYTRATKRGSNRPTLTSDDIGYMYFDTSNGGNKPIWYTGNTTSPHTGWVDSTGVIVNTPTSGNFANKPTVSANSIPIGFRYFCTDKQTTEGATDGIEIIHKGNDVWVDALGRVVS